MILEIPERYLSMASWLRHALPNVGVRPASGDTISVATDAGIHQWTPVEKAIAATTAERSFVVAHRISSTERRHLEHAGIPYLASSGHLFIADHGLLIKIDDPKARTPASAGQTADGLGYSGIRIAQELLAEPGRAWTLGLVSERARVSKARASQVLKLLERNRLIEPAEMSANAGRHVRERSALLDWIERDPRSKRARPRLECAIYATDAIDAAERASQGLAAGGISHSITGSAAAALLGRPVMTSRVAWLRIDSDVPLRFAADTLEALVTPGGGNVMLVRDVGSLGTSGGRYPTESPRLACEPRIYLDLFNEPRGESAAELYRDGMVR